MKRRTMVLLICMLLPQSAWAITWGEVDTENEFPHVGAMMWSLLGFGDGPADEFAAGPARFDRAEALDLEPLAQHGDLSRSAHAVRALDHD